MSVGSRVPCLLSPRALWLTPAKLSLAPASRSSGQSTTPANARCCHGNVGFLLDHPKLVQLVLPSSKSVLPEAELAQPAVLSTPWGPQCLGSAHGSCSLGRGRKSSSVFLRWINFLLNQGTKDVCSHQSSSQTGLYFSFLSYERKNVDLPLAGNTSKFHWGISWNSVFSLCWSAKKEMFYTFL